MLNEKIKQEIKNLILKKKPNNLFLQEVSNLKAKCISSPNINYEEYKLLSNIESSIYRYNNFLKHNMLTNANKEINNLMSLAEEEISPIQGNISNIMYIWHTEPNACPKCQELDGIEYYSMSDIPEKLHPNCKCYVEKVKVDNGACEYCVSALDKFEESLFNAKDILNNSFNVLNEFISFAESKISTIALEKINNVIDALLQIIGTFQDFISSYNELLELNKEKYHEGSPEYFHQKANCQAAQRGEVGEATSIILGQIREFTDYYKDIYKKGMSIEEAEYNNEYDFNQNAEGRKIGKENPNGNCEEILKGRIKVDWPEDF